MIFKLKSGSVLILKCVVLFILIPFGNMFLVSGNMFLENGKLFLDKSQISCGFVEYA
jgi:hypothetical protein